MTNLFGIDFCFCKCQGNWLTTSALKIRLFGVKLFPNKVIEPAREISSPTLFIQRFWTVSKVCEPVSTSLEDEIGVPKKIS
jgi:hypothetical protein